MRWRYVTYLERCILMCVVMIFVIWICDSILYLSVSYIFLKVMNFYFTYDDYWLEIQAFFIQFISFARNKPAISLTFTVMRELVQVMFVFIEREYRRYTCNFYEICTQALIDFQNDSQNIHTDDLKFVWNKKFRENLILLIKKYENCTRKNGNTLQLKL